MPGPSAIWATVTRWATEGGDAVSQCNLGWFYLNGTGVEKNPEKSFELFMKAAEQKNSRGIYNVALAYANGTGVHKDRVKAVEWFRKAAAYGHPGAMFYLGQYSESGLGGLPKDPSKAREWYQRAADKGDQSAKEALERLEKQDDVPDASSPITEQPEKPKTPDISEAKGKDKGGFFKKFFG